MADSDHLDHLTFLDGYLFRTLVDILHTGDPIESGLYNYYQSRIENEGIALSAYDRALVRYVSDQFPDSSRPVVHAGTGLGTLPCAVARSGYRVAGIERDERRLKAAKRVRAALAQAWPEDADRYELIAGSFPDVLEGTSWMTPQTILIFTNCIASWSEDQTARAIASFRNCGDVLLDTLAFGNLRVEEEEQQTLVTQIEAQGYTVAPMSNRPPGTFFCHVRARPNGS